MRIHVARDGLVVIGEPITTWQSAHEAWCETVKDALLEKKWEDVYRMLEKHDIDELAPSDTPVEYTLPLIACVDTAQAKRLIVRFCKMGIGSHPLLAPNERWYYIPNFDGTGEAIFKWSQKFEAAL